MGEGISPAELDLEPFGLEGAYLILSEPVLDERGSFVRSFSREEFEKAGLCPHVAQCNLSFTTQRGTLRGLHYQKEPHGEAKLIRCLRGAAFDVGVDLRPDSTTFCKAVSVELRSDGPISVYLPAGVAHGFLTLVDDVQMHYQMSHPYEQGSARGIRWNDPAFQIEWPEPVRVISQRDQGFPDFVP